MKRNRIHVLIVDDDPTQGKALEEAVKRAGYETTWCNTSAQALTTAQRQEFHCLLVDCMLPKMNGVDLLEEINQFAPRRPKSFLFSGIFKDKNFQKEALERTQAEAFFLKPLDLQEILDRVDHAFRDLLEAGDEPFSALYAQTGLSDEEIVAFISAQSPMHAFHLPMLLRHMQKSHLTGDLTLISSQGDMSTIALHDGQLFAVRTPDKETHFGSIAVGLGFVAADDVAAALSNGGGKKRVGEKLIESFSLSPHALTMILEEQLALRLSQCVRDEIVSLQWVAERHPRPDHALTPLRFAGLLDDWVNSKIELSFLQGVMQNWMGCRLSGHYHHTIHDAPDLAALYAHEEFSEARDLPHLFRQLLHREAFVQSPAESDARDYSFLESRLDHLLKAHETQNYFQVIGIGEKAKALEMNRAFEDFKAHFDPQNLPEDCPPAVRVKCTKVFRHVELAYKTLSDDVERGRYLNLLQNKRSQALIEREPLFRAAIVELTSGQVKAAAKKFQDLLDQKMEFRDLRSYRIWAGLKADRAYRDLTIEHVPPEERHSPPYMMARGLYYRYKGNLQKAFESFRTAHLLDPRLSAAQSELKKLAAELERNRSQHRDLLREVTQLLETFATRMRRGA